MLKENKQNQENLFFPFSNTLDQKPTLHILANKVRWELFEKAFVSLCSTLIKHLATPISLMVCLLMLKHIHNLSDEMVVEQWNQNNYFQYFTRENFFVCGLPYEASESVQYFFKLNIKIDFIKGN